MLLFLSLLLLRQAFVPANSQSSTEAVAAVISGGQNRHIAKGLAMPASTYPESNSTATVILLQPGATLTDTEVLACFSIQDLQAEVRQ